MTRADSRPGSRRPHGIRNGSPPVSAQIALRYNDGMLNDREAVVASHTETRFVELAADQVFDLVADVERYPEFLPFWRSATVCNRTAEGYETEQTLAVGFWVHRFRSCTTLDRPSRIVIRSHDSLFRDFNICWDFSPSENGGCRVDLSFEYAVVFTFLQPVLDLMMMPTASAMVAAFENRARAIAAS